MQYLLSEHEYRALQSARRQLETKSKGELQALCTKIAEAMPVKPDWAPANQPPAPSGCILTTSMALPGYCDDCPVKSICPHTAKRFSK